MLGNYADRVRFVRSLTKLSREGFEKKYGISSSTLKSWELGINTLTEKSAKLISEAINQEGFSCSPEWLIFGLGSEPRPLSQREDEMLLDAINEQAKIIYEADYFKKNNLNSVVCMVTDDSMHPYYKTGDYVGGIKINNFSCLKELGGRACIISLCNETILIRKLLIGKNDQYFLYPENDIFETDIAQKKDILSIANIIWHRSVITRLSYDA